MQPSHQEASTENRQIIHELEEVLAEMLSLEAQNGKAISGLPEEHRASASNLLHYLALRRRDIRLLQDRLAARGLSSLGRTEAHVLGAVRNVLNLLAGPGDGTPAAPREELTASADGQRLLERNTDRLLGSAPASRGVRIMVTMPSEAATDYELIHALLAGGMNCMRINCAHDDEAAWAGMIRHLRKAEAATGRTCKIQMDIAGPKLRTGLIEPGPAVVKVRPERDALGNVLQPARVWLTSADRPQAAPDGIAATLPVPESWLATLKPGDMIRFVDARGAKRAMRVVEINDAGCWAESTRTAYITPGMKLKAGRRTSRAPRKARVGALARQPQSIELRRGDTLILTRSLEPGHPAQYDQGGGLEDPATIGVTLPGFFDAVREGDPIWLDDGKFSGAISEVHRDHVVVKIKQAPVAGAKLRSEKGINVPRTRLKGPALTADDVGMLAFIVQNADIIGFSFVRTEADIHDLQKHLAELKAEHLGIVLKIETRQGFEHLPALLLAAMKSRAVGVMIARGDLAIECGYERLAEVQEEILWIAEAAHAPVIWATQVLESLART
jgi:pyruvate kinase